MIELIQSYLHGEPRDFYSIVGQLEGALDAAEFKDKSLISEWYDYWTPLEIRRAIEGNNVDRKMALEELQAMNEFLLSKETHDPEANTKSREATLEFGRFESPDQSYLPRHELLM